MDLFNRQKKKNASSLMVFLVASLLLPVSSFAQKDNIEYKIKAGYLYNFTKFIFWPENESKTFNLCILGKDPFGSILNAIEKRTVKNKPIRIYRFQSISEVKHCHIIYFGKSDKKWGKPDLSLTGILTIGSYEEILTVSETKQFTQSGGMIAFFLKQGKVKLHINLNTLRKSGLDVSAKLLEVAEIYDGGADE